MKSSGVLEWKGESVLGLWWRGLLEGCGGRPQAGTAFGAPAPKAVPEQTRSPKQPDRCGLEVSWPNVEEVGPPAVGPQGTRPKN